MFLIEISTSLCVCHPVNSKKVILYKKLMESDANFPPIEVVKKDGLYYVRDGNHRCNAAHLIDQKIWAYVWELHDYPNLHLIGGRLFWKKPLGN